MEKIKENIFREYEKVTGKTEFTEKECSLWLSNYEAEDNDEAQELLANKFRSIDRKLDKLSQLRCTLCTGDYSYPIKRIPFAIIPKSKQATNPKIKKEFEDSIKNYLKKTEQTVDYSKEDNLCVLIIFVLGKKDRDKDLDNMSKAFLDSLNNILFPDDSKIIHLNLIKIKDETMENGEIYLNVRKSNFELNKDVIFKLRDYHQNERITLNKDLII